MVCERQLIGYFSTEEEAVEAYFRAFDAHIQGKEGMHHHHLQAY